MPLGRQESPENLCANRTCVPTFHKVEFSENEVPPISGSGREIRETREIDEEESHPNL